MKIDVWINSAGLSNLGRLSFELGSAHEQFGVWTGGPNFTKKTWLLAYLFFSGKFESYRTNIDIEKTFHVVLLLFSILFISEKSPFSFA